MASTPLAIVKDKFGTKADLVKAVEKLSSSDLWLDRVSDKGLSHVSNAKLLRLHAALEDAKKRFGTRAKLVKAIAELENRSKDEGFAAGLSAYSLPRLLDLHSASALRARRPAKPVVAKKKLIRSKKAKAKAAK